MRCCRDLDLLSKLDNPIYNSLCESHKDFAIGDDDIKFFKPEVCPFGAIRDEAVAGKCLTQYPPAREFFVVGALPDLPPSVRVVKELVCLQMVSYESPSVKSLSAGIQHSQIRLMTEDSRAALCDLVLKVQPGYFTEKTPELGDYYGYYEDNQLVALIGERIKMAGLTELSAIVTHPDYTRRGLATQLTAYLTCKLHNKGEVPFLHVLETNTSAISLYRKLGFEVRRRMTFWRLERV